MLYFLFNGSVVSVQKPWPLRLPAGRDDAMMCRGFAPVIFLILKSLPLWTMLLCAGALPLLEIIVYHFADFFLSEHAVFCFLF